jgi:hypothetical protein
MKDKWMNMGYEEEELKPFIEPEPDFKDPKRIGTSLATPTSACERMRVTAIASEARPNNLFHKLLLLLLHL